jgi:hypothetical protein
LAGRFSLFRKLRAPLARLVKQDGAAMRGKGKWMAGLLLAAGVAAGAQQQNRTSPGANSGAHAAFHAPGVQMPGAFVSQPGRFSQPGQAIFAPGHAVFPPGPSVFPAGQSVFTPGQSIFPPGQTVFPQGQTVFPAGQAVFPPGNRIFPAPNVLTPFHSAPATTMRRGGERHHERDHDHDRYHYRHRDGEGYAVPYLFGSGYWLSSGDLGYSGDSEQTQTRGAAASEVQPSSGVAAQPAAPPPSSESEDTYRPAYHAAASSSDVIPSQEPKLTVVMKDGTHKTMRNYALTPTTLIDLDAAATGREMDIPLEQVNVTATQKAAAREGLNFSVPKGG